MSGCNEILDKDFPNLKYPGELPQPLPKWEQGLKIAACVFVEILAILGNLLVIGVVVRTPRMRSTINLYIANMAVADMLIALGPMWILVSTDVIDQDGWPLGSFLCKFNSFVQVTAMVASVLTLMAIAGDRFFAINFPLKSRVTERRVGVVVAFLWLCALAIGLPPLFFYTHTERLWKDYLETFCTDVWPITTTGDGECDQGLTSKRAYWTLVTVVLNWLPMAVMSVVYAVIIHRLQFSRVPPSAAGRSSMSAVQRKSKRKVVKMLLIMLVSFMVCTIPFQVTNLYPLYSHHPGDKLPAWHKPVSYAAVFLMYTNSAINPILYGGLNDRFRRAAWDLLNVLLCRQASASSLSSQSRTRISVVEEEARRAKDKKDASATKISLQQLVASAAYINTVVLEAKRKRRGNDRSDAGDGEDDDDDDDVEDLPRNGSTVSFEGLDPVHVIFDNDGLSVSSAENEDSLSDDDVHAAAAVAAVREDRDSLSSRNDSLAESEQGV